MIIGKIIGEVVSSAKHESHEGIKLLLVRQLDLTDAQRARSEHPDGRRSVGSIGRPYPLFLRRQR